MRTLPGTLDAAGNLDHADSPCRGERPAECPTVLATKVATHRCARASLFKQTSRFRPVQAGESGGAHSQRACRRYAASPPWTAAGRRTFIGAGYRRAAQDILASLAASYLTLGTPNEAVLAHSVGFFRQDSEVDVGLVYADYYLLEAISRMRSACPWARACGRRCHRPRRSR